MQVPVFRISGNVRDCGGMEYYQSLRDFKISSYVEDRVSRGRMLCMVELTLSLGSTMSNASIEFSLGA